MNQQTADRSSALLGIPPHEFPGDFADVLGQLARLGELVEREPRLLSLRARCRAAIGHTESALDDVRDALALTTDDALRRWLLVLDVQLRFGIAGDGASARRRLLAVLDAADDAAEVPTLAQGYRVLAEITAAEESTASLQKAGLLFQLATRLWEQVGSRINANASRKWHASVLGLLGRHREAIAAYDALLADPEMIPSESSWVRLMRGFACTYAGQLDDAQLDADIAERMARSPLDPIRISSVAWLRTVVEARRGNLTGAIQQAKRAEAVATAVHDGLTAPCLCELSLEFGALGDVERAAQYLERARGSSTGYESVVEFAAFVLRARQGIVPADVGAVIEQTEPGLWARGLVVAALAAARHRATERARELLRDAERELARLGLDSFAVIGEHRAFVELSSLLGVAGTEAAPVARKGPMALHVFGERLELLDGQGHEVVVAGRNQRALLGVIAAAGGSISVDGAAEALWPDEPTGVGRRRLHNVHTRLRETTGRSFRHGEMFTLGDIRCDLLEFDRRVDLVSSNFRRNPDHAADHAIEALALMGPDVLTEFAGEWAEASRIRTLSRRFELIDFLAVRAADAGDAELADRWQATLAAAS